MNKSSNSIKTVVYGRISKISKNTLYVREEDFEIGHGEDYKIAIEELQKIESVSIFGKLIKQHLSYDDVSLWWFIYQSIIPEFKKSLNFTKNFLELINDTHPSKIIIDDDYEKFFLIKQICDKKKINLEYSKNKYFTLKIKHAVKTWIQQYRYKKISTQKIHNRKKIFFQNNSKIPSTKNKIIFSISTNFRRSIFNHERSELKRGEYLMQPIIDMFDKSDVMGIDLDYTFLGQPRILTERITEEMFWIPLDILLESKINSKKKNFLKKYEKFISKKEFQDLFQYSGISLWNELKYHFIKMAFFPYLPFYLHILDSLYDYFSKNKPRIMFIPYETGSIALALISIMNRIGVKTIGVQHGYIYPNNPMYSQTDFATGGNKNGFPLPDYTLLFGEYPRKLLISNGYPPDKLIAFGNPSFFNLKKIVSSLDSEQSKKKYGIKNNAHVILFTTGKLQRAYLTHGKYDYDEKIMEKLLEKFSNDENFFIIIKTHPTETNIQVYKKILKQFSSNNVIITQDNLFELINLSSIVISVFSSTMLDALCFNKNIIRVKAGEEFNPVFDNSRAVLVSDLQNLNTNILKIITNPDSCPTKEEIAAFVKTHYGIPETNPEILIKQLMES